ncbi:uncharacterized protein LOC124815258 isoform X1 [Hydra vulgaris]|uniref:uncharacterized protein LOC124815258 isoform X1 n=1 Tax=Hydra vulgaris TaxID=6087 RepID=UPI001F5EC4DB|nr:uncharacterized protein LOC124815258 [Hydra vulgaris]
MKINVFEIGKALIENRFAKSPRHKLKQENYWRQYYFVLFKLRDDWISCFGENVKLRATKGDIKLKETRTSLFLVYWQTSADRYTNVKPVEIFPLKVTNIPVICEHPYWPDKYQNVIRWDMNLCRLYLCAESQAIVRDWINKYSEQTGIQSFECVTCDEETLSDVNVSFKSSESSSRSSQSSLKETSRSSSTVSLATEILNHFSTSYSNSTKTILKNNSTLIENDDSINCTLDAKRKDCDDIKKQRNHPNLTLQRSMSFDYTPMNMNGRQMIGQKIIDSSNISTSDEYDSDRTDCTPMSIKACSNDKYFKTPKSTLAQSFTEKSDYKFKRKPCYTKINRESGKVKKRTAFQKIDNPMNEFIAEDTINNYIKVVSTSHLNKPNFIENMKEDVTVEMTNSTNYNMTNEFKTLNVGDVQISFPFNSQLIFVDNNKVTLRTEQVTCNIIKNEINFHV